MQYQIGETVASVEVDYDLLAEKVAALIPAVQSGAAVIAAPSAAEIALSAMASSFTPATVIRSLMRAAISS